MTEPEVYLIARPQINWHAVRNYLISVGGESWLVGLSGPARPIDAQDLTEIGGRLCYRSWKPGLNANVKRVRSNRAAYFENILSSGHGSVLEHANFSFIFHHVSRVFTHELVRHRVGTAVSQESLRFVRLTDIPFWLPDWAETDDDLIRRMSDLIVDMEEFQLWAADHFDLDDEGVPFAEKKHKTSFMRRLAPEGIATDVMWTANIRTLRHVIEARTAESAEEEMRLVFGKVAVLMKEACPLLFSDFENNNGSWVPKWHKV